MAKNKGKRDLMFNAVLIKENDELVYRNSADGELYKQFKELLDEGQSVEIFLDANKDDGTLAQLAKVHKCTRELAKFKGYSFEDMKLYVKKAAGLCIRKDIDGEMMLVVKSFGDCSKEDLGLAIQAIIEMGDHDGINFR